MRRLNALAAVRRLMPTFQNQPVYIVDQDANALIAIEIDPMTGATGAPLLPDRAIPLTLTKEGASFAGHSPRSLAISPAGDLLYTLVSALQPRTSA